MTIFRPDKPLYLPERHLPQIETHFPKLYKYTKSTYADEMVGKGRFRIGTLYEYRKSTQKEIGDVDEGTKSFSFDGAPDELQKNLETFRKNNPDIHPVKGMHDMKAAIAKGVPIGLVQHTPDVYLFCMTKTFDADVMRSFGYDACIEIFDPRRFYEAMYEGMRRVSLAWVLRECKYTNRWAKWDNHGPHFPDVMKPLSLIHQDEVRLIYASHREYLERGNLNPLDPIFIESRNAGRYCRRII